VTSEESLGAVRWLYDEWAKGNLWAVRDIADPNIEWEWAEAFEVLGRGPRVCHGLEEVEAATREWLEAWDFYWMTADDFIEAGDQIIVPMHLHARTRGVERVIEQPLVAVWTLRGGRAVAVRYFDDAARAFEAAGTAE
jgi:ketosteroid isomerase-like protein